MVVIPVQAPETNQANAIAYIELQNVTPIIKRLVAIRCPCKMIRIDEVVKFRLRDSKKVIRFLVRGIDGIAVSVCNLAGVIFGCKGRCVATTLGNSAFNFVK